MGILTAPSYPINLYELVPHLLNRYPSWTEEDLLEFLEERTRRSVHPEDLQTLRALYQRHAQWEAEFLIEF